MKHDLAEKIAFTSMKLLAAFLCLAAARKAPKKFESATEMTPDAPAIEASKDQLFCVAPPDAPTASLIFGSIRRPRHSSSCTWY